MPPTLSDALSETVALCSDFQGLNLSPNSGFDELKLFLEENCVLLRK
jgi:hypothetical protein